MGPSTPFFSLFKLIPGMKALRAIGRAQVLVASCGTHPDILYDAELVAVYVDGPHHRYPERLERDRNQTARMEDLGYTAIRFAGDEDWSAKIATHPNVFGKVS